MSIYRWSRKAVRSIQNDLPLKGLALAVAIVLFALVRGAQDAQRTFFVEINPLLPPEKSGQVLVSHIPQEVRVTLQGSQSVLTMIQREGLPAVDVDLQSTAGRFFYFEPSLFELPPGVSIVQVFPASMRLSYAKRYEKRLKIEPRLVGASRRGFSVFEPLKLVPNQVRIHGPEDRVSAIDTIRTEPIDIASLPIGTHVMDVPLQALPEFVSYLDDTTVKVEIEIVPEIRERKFRRLNVAIMGAGMRARPSKVTVTLQGPPQLLDALDPEDIVPYIDLIRGSLTRGATRAFSIKVHGIPTGVKVSAIEPAEVMVTSLR